MELNLKSRDHFWFCGWQVIERGREVVWPALHRQSPAISYAWKMKCAHAGWVFQHDWYYFCSSTHTFSHSHLSAAEYKWRIWMLQLQLPQLQLLLRGTCAARFSVFASNSVCSQHDICHPQGLHILVSFLVYRVGACRADAVYCEYWGVVWWPEMTIAAVTPSSIVPASLLFPVSPSL